MTIYYGGIFTYIQALEYCVAPFSINDGVFGSLFFMLTGFHGFHVLVGSIFLAVCFQRQINYHFTVRQHVGLECGI
jgi:heme/copper-type cytochrome/quinol oxidase subunit 3